MNLSHRKIYSYCRLAYNRMQPKRRRVDGRVDHTRVDARTNGSQNVNNINYENNIKSSKLPRNDSPSNAAESPNHQDNHQDGNNSDINNNHNNNSDINNNINANNASISSNNNDNIVYDESHGDVCESPTRIRLPLSPMRPGDKIQM